MKRDARGRFVKADHVQDAPEEKVYMTGFKGFEPGLVCRGKQYSENTVFEEQAAEVCQKGIHFCANPLDVLDFYPLQSDDCQPNEFAEVEALSKPITKDQKSVSSKVHIKAKLNLAGFCKASFDYLHRLCHRADSPSEYWSKQSQSREGSQQSQSGSYSSQSQSGECSLQVQSGYWSKQSQSGYGSQQSQSGDCGQQSQSGNESKQSQSGYWGQQAQSGDRSQQVQSGDRSTQAQSGEDSQQSQSGDWSQQVQSGKESWQSQSGYGSRQASVGTDSSAVATAEDCLVAVLGPNGQARGKLGCVLVLASYRDSGKGFQVIDQVFSARVDGKEIKEDTWYRILNGKFTEVC